jgi:hypothetical protein
MTLSTSLVAVWYSSDTWRSPVRCCKARWVSALAMAITACSAKVFSSSTWLSEKPPHSRLPRASAPIAAPPRINGTKTLDLTVRPRMAGLSHGSASKSRMWTT